MFVLLKNHLAVGKLIGDTVNWRPVMRTTFLRTVVRLVLDVRSCSRFLSAIYFETLVLLSEIGEKICAMRKNTDTKLMIYK